MARSRNIKPGFFLNEELAEIEPLGRLLFAGLWTLADREGRLEDRPKRIKAAVLPYDNCDVDHLLNELHKRGFIIRYEVNGGRYIQIVNWHKHQNPHHKEVKSEIPPYPGKGDSEQPGKQEKVMLEPSINQEQTNHGPSMNQDQANKIASCPTDSLNLIPDSFNSNTAASKNTQSSKEDTTADDNGSDVAADDHLKPAESDNWLSDDLTEEQKAEMEAVTEHWRKKRGIMMIPPLDLEAMEELIKKGIPAADIIKGIDKTFADFAERNRSKPWKKINSFRYCLQTIYEIHHARTTGSNVRPFPVRHVQADDLPRSVREQMEREARGEEFKEPEVDPAVQAEILAELNQMRSNFDKKKALAGGR